MQRRGSATSRQAYDDVAEAVGIAPGERRERSQVGGRSVNVYERAVRWAQQRARLQGLARRVGPDDWRLTGKGCETLRKAKPTVVITLWMTDLGCALFGSCEDAFSAHLDDFSVQTLLTSPPYPLLRPKQYNNTQDEAAYVDWMVRLAEQWARKLTPDGSLIVNLGDVWEPGRPSLSLYQERLLIRLQEDVGFRLCQRFEWFKTAAAMPAPAEWVTVRRVRVKPALEKFLWLSQSASPKADNRQVLAPYSDSMGKLLAAGGMQAAKRPSGYGMADGAFSERHEGAIPTNLITAANTSSSGAYMRRCREAGLPIHPARFPEALPEFFIKLTTSPGDLVAEPFGGSFTTARVAESLGRRWVACEQVLEYARGGRLRFEDSEVTFDNLA